MADEERGLAEEPVDEVAGRSPGDQGQPHRGPPVVHPRRGGGHTDDERDLDAGEQPRRVAAHGEGRAGVEQEREAEPVADHRHRLPGFQPPEHQRLDRLVDHGDGDNRVMQDTTTALSLG